VGGCRRNQNLYYCNPPKKVLLESSTWNYCLNMAISQKAFPLNLATLAHFFHKNPSYEWQWSFFWGLQVGKSLQGVLGNMETFHFRVVEKESSWFEEPRCKLVSKAGLGFNLLQMQPPKKECYHLTMTIRVFREWIMNGNKFFLAIANCCLITNAEQIKATLGTRYFSWLLA
jgi:hypothetical protein